MTVGLSFGELIDAFGKSISNRYSSMEAERLTTELGLNPDMQKQLERVSKQYGIPENQALMITLFIESFLDTIICNNEAISKSLNL